MYVLRCVVCVHVCMCVLCCVVLCVYVCVCARVCVCANALFLGWLPGQHDRGHAADPTRNCRPHDLLPSPGVAHNNSRYFGLARVCECVCFGYRSTFALVNACNAPADPVSLSAVPIAAAEKLRKLRPTLDMEFLTVERGLFPAFEHVRLTIQEAVQERTHTCTHTHLHTHTCTHAHLHTHTLAHTHTLVGNALAVCF